MQKYEHILVAADLIKKDDDLVLERALEISKATGADISLVHVIEYFYTYGGAPWEVEDTVDWQQEVENTAVKKLNDLGESLDVPPERRHLHIGQTMDAILHTAKDINADLVIVGSHGRHGLGLMLFGSTANSILQNARCDILAVRISPKEAPTKRLSQHLFAHKAASLQK